MKIAGFPLIIFLFAAPVLGFSQQLTSQVLLDKSIQYHDPEGVWAKEKITFSLRETRPGNPDRQTLVTIDIPHVFFSIDQARDGHQLYSEIQDDNCKFKLDGKVEISEEDLKTHRLNCERTATIRDYYTYLWGLPMKLKDPGTILDSEVAKATFEGQSCFSFRVTYSQEVGSDIWYFTSIPKLMPS